MPSIRSVARRSSLNIGSPTPHRARSAERSLRQADDELNVVFSQEDVEITAEDASRQRLPSESSLSRQVRSHRRAMSDPFDNADLDDIADGDEDGLLEEKQFALPTLQRFPFAETNNRNCWSEPAAKIFSVRGPHYLSDKKKVTAEKYLLRAIGCDLFLSDKPGDVDIGRYVEECRVFIYLRGEKTAHSNTSLTGSITNYHLFDTAWSGPWVENCDNSQHY